MFDNGVLLITGGTGSFGHTVLNHFLTSDIKEIRIFSRDEKKQDDMRHELQARYPNEFNKVRFYIGDVRDRDSMTDAMHGVNYVFHAAALKEVPSCEFFPMQACETNVIGTNNVVNAAINNGVKTVVFLSTDKAAYPINAMGISKALAERVIFANARIAAERGTTLCCTRYGNVMCSRGSVIPLFVNQIKSGSEITITDPNMTRFLMNLDEAVALVMFAFEHANPGDNYYRITADSRDLNYDKFLVNGNVKTQADEEYTSSNTHILTVEETVEKIKTTEFIQKEIIKMESKK